ncbi:hypothetical protein [Burkholderia sp. AU15512]|uniref:hypothetical protein n=1 Tax=Burkholderia sp. AU15512 TaxID=2015345 RepID=UPI000B79D2D1|nr:hypothetical protein [Burkholderia sp. AU15512]OXI24333.1 hypothetical protein CFB43_06455 [Burkholderia sp. AU15512]
MDKIKQTRDAFEAWASREELHLVTGNCGWYLADNTAKAWKAWQECATRMNDMAEILEIIATDADSGTILLTSGIRMALDAALIKAGRKAAPEPVRHFRACGEGL